ncbi:MAG: AAA family ATPase [Sphaerochaeta sp.]|jgi:cytidylate kinase|nr:AAA family ATPase [Sphaerochaeta sp.]MDX9915405.1 AAA family ATPase [Sphaerochaeta sp.]
MRIAISGKSGCGNTTVTRLVSEALGYEMINFTFRTLAEERGLDFWHLSRLAERDDTFDLEVDRRQVEMARSHQRCVLGSRLAIWMLKEADVKIFLDATIEERSRRIAEREGGTIEERMAETVDRDRRDSARYKRLYSIDNNDTSIADVVIDTTALQAEEVAALIIEEVHRRET